MDVQPDFKELFALLNEHKVEFLIAGGYALAFHGAPRYTGDIDIFINPTPENANKVINALDAFGFSSMGLKPEDFEHPEQVIQLGVPPVRIDFLTSLSGVTWDNAFFSRESTKYGDVPVHYISRATLITNKRALGRTKDRADLEALGEN